MRFLGYDPRSHQARGVRARGRHGRPRGRAVRPRRRDHLAGPARHRPVDRDGHLGRARRAHGARLGGRRRRDGQPGEDEHLRGVPVRLAVSAGAAVRRRDPVPSQGRRRCDRQPEASSPPGGCRACAARRRRRRGAGCHRPRRRRRRPLPRRSYDRPVRRAAGDPRPRRRVRCLPRDRRPEPDAARAGGAVRHRAQRRRQDDADRLDHEPRAPDERLDHVRRRRARRPLRAPDRPLGDRSHVSEAVGLRRAHGRRERRPRGLVSPAVPLPAAAPQGRLRRGRRDPRGRQPRRAAGGSRRLALPRPEAVAGGGDGARPAAPAAAAGRARRRHDREGAPAHRRARHEDRAGGHDGARHRARHGLRAPLRAQGDGHARGQDPHGGNGGGGAAQRDRPRRLPRAPARRTRAAEVPA